MTPFGYGHGFDEFKLEVGLREVLGDDAGEHGVETVLVFSFHDDGLREEAVAFGVAGADLLLWPDIMAGFPMPATSETGLQKKKGLLPNARAGGLPQWIEELNVPAPPLWLQTDRLLMSLLDTLHFFRSGRRGFSRYGEILRRR